MELSAGFMSFHLPHIHHHNPFRHAGDNRLSPLFLVFDDLLFLQAIRGPLPSLQALPDLLHDYHNMPLAFRSFNLIMATPLNQGNELIQI